MIDKNIQAILLLCTHFSESKKGEPKPLTPTEFRRFSSWLFDNKIEPKLLIDDFKKIIDLWQDPKEKISSDRLRYLLGRGLEMSLSLDKWQSAGIWIMSRKDPEYPYRLKDKLQDAMPSILFGVGNKKLLNTGGLGVVGSRNITKNDQQFTSEIAKKAALDGRSIVSGGARGVDETAMLSALDSEGTAIGILADGLLEKSLSKKWRKHLKNNSLVLISTFYPEAGFNVGNAMARNKYIYCLSDAALVVQSGLKGGTINGAMENLKKEWTPLWVKQTNDSNTGNIQIENAGGIKCQDSIEKIQISDFFIQEKSNSTSALKKSNQLDLWT